MLKIATVSWKGRCRQHPAYNPAEHGTPGNCVRCNGLFEIYRQHRQLLGMIRQFGPLRERSAKPVADRQGRLF